MESFKKRDGTSLQRKRHAEKARSSAEHTTPKDYGRGSSSYNALTTGQKRSYSDDHDEPPTKKASKVSEESHSRNADTNNYKPNVYPSSSHKSSTAGTKNLAAKRMQNLRKSLQMSKDNATSDWKVPTSHKSVLVRERTTSTKKSEHERTKRFDKFSSEKLRIVPPKSPTKAEIMQKHRDARVAYRRRQNDEQRRHSDEPRRHSDEQQLQNSEQRKTQMPTTSAPIDTTEHMDWSPIDEVQLIQNINSIRTDILMNTAAPIAPTINECRSSSTQTNQLHIVVDSNVFLLSLNFVAKLEEAQIPGFENVIIYVPWIVLEELDYIKSGRSKMRSLQKTAQNAVRFINGKLSERNPRYKGQTIMDASRFSISSPNPDDSILFSCMQLVDDNHDVVLLSNDINLRNKALMHNIKSYSHTDIMDNLVRLIESQSTQHVSLNVDEIKKVLTNLLSFIIIREMEGIYGDIWMRIIYIKPPFTLEDCLKNIAKHWMAVFHFKLQKQCRLCIDEFLTMITKNRSDYNLTQDQYNNYIGQSLKLCIYLKNGYKDHADRIAQTLSTIQASAQ